MVETTFGIKFISMLNQIPKAEIGQIYLQALLLMDHQRSSVDCVGIKILFV